MDFSGGVHPPDDKTWNGVRRINARSGVEVTAMRDEEIKNPREWDFDLDANETLGDGRTWKLDSKVFHQ